MTSTLPELAPFDSIRIEEAAAALEGIVRRTPLAAADRPPFAEHLADLDPRLELRLKLENRQETNAFKARGAWNQVRQLTPEQRAAGVVAASSGNHGRALAWAAGRAGIPATIVMPQDAYPNKIAACRELGAEVVLTPTRSEADAVCARLVGEGRVLVHPYDAERTIEGAGTVGLELAREWPEVELVLVPAGGGGLAAGTSLALRRALGRRVRILAVEPAGAPTLSRGLAAGEPVTLERIDTSVQGLCPPRAGVRNVDVCRVTLDGVLLVEDDEVHAAQARLVRAGEVVEPAGAATLAALLSGRVPEELFPAEGRLRVAAVVSGGNPDPAQLAAVASAAP